MAIKVYKVADIVGERVALCGQRKSRDDAVGILSNFQPAHDPIPNSSWGIELLIGQGAGEHQIIYPLPPLLSNSDPKDFPVFLQNSKGILVYFQNRLFILERAPLNMSEHDEVALRVKKATYDEGAELSSLRDAVANLEAAIEFQKSGSKRAPIPEDVKLAVWARDGGACARCGSSQDLHFDHIIPVAKGGGNSESNIQILCQLCNLKKADKIAIT